MAIVTAAKLPATFTAFDILYYDDDSKYFQDMKTKDWIKIKYLLDDDFVICGYILKGKGVISIILGQYSGEKLVYKGHVTMGISTEDFRIIESTPKN